MNELHNDPHASTATILLVEDDEMLLDLIATVLEEHGYRVIKADDGLQAVEQFTRHHREIALVLTDMGLPHLGGWEAFQKMKAIDPNVKTIMASGYVDPNLKAEMLQAGARDFVQKPYVVKNMLSTIREVLNAP